ncbi:MAG TPA: serine/threonine-protein kinase [Roseiflexaceae bacterium]|nr:serine/threonine-protein kinase [Roseiflexaceae bacterium]
MSTPTTLIGETLGSYEIQSLLGSGGMATVYQGFDQQLHRSVAVKVLAATLAADPTYVNRFRQEARLIANLRHPHIAQVYAFGEHNGSPYMVQELLPGPTLEQRLKDLAAQGTTMPQAEVLDTVSQLAGALDAAHAVGVIHRDVKPSNALYNAQRQIVLTDFGIARNTADASRTATAAGMIMGTPGYIAPEQAIGSATLTPACDVYALGVVLFELLAGRLPFEADTAMGVVLKHLYDPPPAPTSVRPSLPPALDAVVLRALEKEPSARFPSAGALAQALAAAWPVAGAPVAPPAQDIHSQATAVWVRPSPSQAAQPAHPAQATQVNQPAPTPRPAATATTSRIAVPPAAAPAPPAAQPAPPAGPPSRLLIPLGLLLLAVLGIGGFLALRGGDDQTAVAPPPAAAATADPAAASPEPDNSAPLPANPSPAPVDPSPVAVEQPPVVVEQSPVAVEPSPVPVEPSPVPTEPPALAADPFDGLRVLLNDEATWPERGKGEGKNLIDKLDDLQRALERGENKKAYDLVRDMAKKIVDLANDDKMDVVQAEAGLNYLSQIAGTYGLSEDSKDDKGKDKGKDDDDDD